jgi:hypothetical protein
VAQRLGLPSSSLGRWVSDDNLVEGSRQTG